MFLMPANLPKNTGYTALLLEPWTGPRSELKYNGTVVPPHCIFKGSLVLGAIDITSFPFMKVAKKNSNWVDLKSNIK